MQGARPDAQSDLDFLIFGGDGFRLTEILFSLMRHRIIWIVSFFIRDLVLDQLEEDGELEEARILKALELSRIKKSTIWRKCYKNG